MSKAKTRLHYRWDDVYSHELVSLEAAREVYKVVIDPATRKIDWQQTQALRGCGLDKTVARRDHWR